MQFYEHSSKCSPVPFGTKYTFIDLSELNDYIIFSYFIFHIIYTARLGGQISLYVKDNDFVSRRFFIMLEFVIFKFILYFIVLFLTKMIS